MNKISLRPISEKDCPIISAAFKAQAWNKPSSQFEHYLSLQKKGFRDVILATVGQQFAGYLTIAWQSTYLPFQTANIPEIVDFNVLKKYQRQGIGTALMNEAEKRIRAKSHYAGIGVGLMQDYGAAQILYVKRGYIPDGRGIARGGQYLKYGDKVSINDDLALYLLKDLR